MIITLTMNPAIDKTLTLETFSPHHMNRAISSIEDPGGKGINVSKVIQSLGGESVAMGLIGGTAGHYIQSALTSAGIPQAFTWINGCTRTNLKIFVKESGETIEINEPGPSLMPDELNAVVEKLLSSVDQETIVVLAGSVPADAGTDFYKMLIPNLKNRGATVILDADGPLFSQGIHGHPDMIKPNKKELEAYFNQAIESHQALQSCADHFHNIGIPQVFITLGADGAYYSNGTNTYQALPLEIEVNSAVGAGDAFVGALAYGLSCGYENEDLFRVAVAASAGAVTTEGTKPAPLSWVKAHLPLVCIQSL